MKLQDLPFLPIFELTSLIQRKEISPREVTQAFLERIQSVNPQIGAFITVLWDEAMRQAKEKEQAILHGNYCGTLHGIPLAIKDIICTKGDRTTAGSKILSDFVPQQDATVISHLRDAGAILLGKLNCNEFALGVNGDNPHYGFCHNPWKLNWIAGGSSGGSAAAVGASLCAGALGTDTGGSVRIPASLCGTVGLKPTYRRVSRYGIIPLSWTLDHVGPITKRVQDASIMLSAIAGHDAKDPTSSHRPARDYFATPSGDIQGLSVGIPKNYFFDILDPEVEEAVRRAIRVLESLGASLKEVDINKIEYALAALWGILLAEARSCHEEFMHKVPEDYGQDVRIILEAGQFVTATRYLKALRVRRLIQDGLRSALAKVNVIVTPTTPVTATPQGTTRVKIRDRDYELMGTLSRYTIPFSLTGVPAITVPCGFSSGGLPIGMQIVGKPFDEDTVFKVAYAYETNTSWHKQLCYQQLRPDKTGQGK